MLRDYPYGKEFELGCLALLVQEPHDAAHIIDLVQNRGIPQWMFAGLYFVRRKLTWQRTKLTPVSRVYVVTGITHPKPFPRSSKNPRLRLHSQCCRNRSGFLLRMGLAPEPRRVSC